MTRCPYCKSQSVTVISSEPFDFGVDPATGYHDCGEVGEWRCVTCGKSGDDIVAVKVLARLAA